MVMIQKRTIFLLLCCGLMGGFCLAGGRKRGKGHNRSKKSRKKQSDMEKTEKALSDGFLTDHYEELLDALHGAKFVQYRTIWRDSGKRKAGFCHTEAETALGEILTAHKSQVDIDAVNKMLRDALDKRNTSKIQRALSDLFAYIISN